MSEAAMTEPVARTIETSAPGLSGDGRREGGRLRIAIPAVIMLFGAVHALVGLGGVIGAVFHNRRLLEAVLVGAASREPLRDIGSVPLDLIGHYAFNLLLFGVFVAVLGGYAYAGNRFARWTAVGALTSFEVGFFLFIALPGHVEPLLTAIGPLLALTVLGLTLVEAAHGRGR